MATANNRYEYYKKIKPFILAKQDAISLSFADEEELKDFLSSSDSRQFRKIRLRCELRFDVTSETFVQMTNIPELEDLDIINCSVQGSQLQTELRLHPKMKKFSFTHGKLEDSGAKDTFVQILQNMPNLSVLKMSFMYLGVDDFGLITDVLKDKVYLSELHLRKNDLFMTGAQIVAEALQDKIHLSVLDLSSTLLYESGARIIAGALRDKMHLTVLDMSDNKLTDGAAIALADVLRDKVRLSALSVAHGLMTQVGIDILVAALRDKPAWSKLDTTFNVLDDATVSAIVAGFRDAVGVPRDDE